MNLVVLYNESLVVKERKLYDNMSRLEALVHITIEETAKSVSRAFKNFGSEFAMSQEGTRQILAEIRRNVQTAEQQLEKSTKSPYLL